MIDFFVEKIEFLCFICLCVCPESIFTPFFIFFPFFLVISLFNFAFEYNTNADLQVRERKMKEKQTKPASQINETKLRKKAMRKPSTH